MCQSADGTDDPNADYHPLDGNRQQRRDRADPSAGGVVTDKEGSPTRAAAQPAPGAPLAAAPVLQCPKCHGVMRTYARAGLTVELCEDCRGMFLDQGELERLIEAEGGGWSGIVSAAVDATRPTRP